jgi:long-chain acyl-CoA synthetase
VPIALFGAAWAGVPFAPLSYRLTDPEVAALLERLAPVWLVTDPARAAAPIGAKDVTPRDALLAPPAASPEPPAPDWPDDGEAIALLLFTSGTTGAAQGGRAAPPPPGLLRPGARSSSAPPARTRRRS